MRDERKRPPPPFFARSVLYLIVLALYVPLFCVVVGAFQNGEHEFTFGWFPRSCMTTSCLRRSGIRFLSDFARALWPRFLEHLRPWRFIGEIFSGAVCSKV